MLHRKEQKIDSKYFKSIVINVQADDLVITKIEDEECIVKLSIKNNIDDEILLEHLINSDMYDVDLDIKNEILYIDYSKKKIALLNNPDYFEVVGVIILVPKWIDYVKK
jgi:hypothetical protein